MGLGLRHFSDRVPDGAGELSGHPVLDADAGEVLLHVQPSVAVVLGRRPPDSPGTLFVSSKRVVWLSDVDAGKGYAVDFLSISLHAVSTDPEAYPSPCIYTQIETEDDGNEDSGDSELESDEDLDLSKITEMRLVPSDPTQLDILFNVFCECAELNPEPCHEEQEEANDWIFGPDQMGDDSMEADDAEFCNSEENSANPIGCANGDHELIRPVLELQIDDERFEDAEDVEQNTRHSRE